LKGGMNLISHNVLKRFTSSTVERRYIWCNNVFDFFSKSSLLSLVIPFSPAFACWTKCHIIPYWADPRDELYCEKKKEMFDLLEILHYPTYENVKYISIYLTNIWEKK
jgi:hypothetical protein